MIYQKINLVALIFWLLQAPAVSSKNEVSPEKFVKYLNNLRREMAKTYKVPNMHELIWSDELANLPINWTDAPISYPSWFCSFPVPSMQVPLENLEQDIKEHLKEEQPSRCHRIDNVLGFLYPLQTFIGCSKKGTKMCLVGPNKRTSMFDASGNSTAIPGSKCKAKFENVDGLCVAKEPEKLTYFKGDREEFLNEINSVRRMMAKKYNLPSMHKLTWSKPLEDLASRLDLKNNSEWKLSTTRKYRDTEIVYPGIAEAIIEQIEEFANLSPFSKKTVIGYEYSYDTRLYYEYLNVHQKHIGCAYRENNPEFYQLCLLGDSLKFELWDFDVKSTSEPASKCSKGYVKDDGLCSKASGASEGSDSGDVADSDGVIYSNLASSFSTLLCFLLVQFFCFLLIE